MHYLIGLLYAYGVYFSKSHKLGKGNNSNVNKLSFKSIVGVAQFLNPMIRGWVHYYGKFKMFELTKVFRLLSMRLVWWARKRYKRYKTSIRKAYKWLASIRKQFPTLFYHWNFSQINVIA